MTTFRQQLKSSEHSETRSIMPSIACLALFTAWHRVAFGWLSIGSGKVVQLIKQGTIGSFMSARDEHIGAFFLSFTPLGYSPSSRCCFEVEKGQPLRCVLRLSWYNITGRAAGQERSALLQHRITMERRASYSVRVFPRTALSSFLQPVSKFEEVI